MTRLGAAATLAAAAAALGAGPQFRSGVEVVRVDVYVSDRGRPVLGLTREDFEIRDNRVLQRVEHVSFEEAPINLVMALDTSGSVRDGRLAQLGAAAGALLDALRDGDEAALLTFNHVVASRQPLTRDLGAVRRALGALTGGGHTALHDALHAGMLAAQADADRAIVVLLSDGVDTMSWLTADAVLDTARRSDVVVYSVFTGGPRTPSLLRDIADATGGRVFDNISPDRLRGAFTQIAEEFRNRYVVTYTPSGVQPGGWHALDVRIRGRRVTVKARPGYLGGGQKG